MDPSIDSIKASDGSAPASIATVQNVRAPLAATIIVNTVSGINTNFHGSMGTPHTFTDPVTSETITVISEATNVDFRGHVDGSDLVIDEIAPGFTDAGSEVGDIVIIKPTTQGQDQLAEILEVAHRDDGEVNATAIYDANDNETLKLGATASAVNEVTLTNAATGNGPTISATGGDTNIDLRLLGKGSGSARFAGIHDGWIEANETLTYATASTLTCSATLAANLSIGDKLKLTQTTVKYFYVVGISGTTVTVTGGTDYTLADAAITLPFYSKSVSPTGFPQWFAFTPTVTSATGSITTVTPTALFKISGRAVIYKTIITINSAGTGGGAMLATTPVAATTGSDGGAGREDTNTGYQLQYYIIPSDLTHLRIQKYDGTYRGSNNDVHRGTIVYQI